MKNAFYAGKKYLLTIKCPGGRRTLFGQTPSQLGLIMIQKFGEDGVLSFVRGESNIYEVRNDHPTLKDGWFLQPVNFSVVRH
jgi:hypothetical protein